MPTILVVEDEPIARLSIAEHLKGCGFHVVEVGSAAEALAHLETNAIDLVFTDIQMPGAMNGIGLAQWVREHRPTTKIVLASGLLDVFEIAQDLCDGGHAFSKPYAEAAVSERITRLVAT